MDQGIPHKTRDTEIYRGESGEKPCRSFVFSWGPICQFSILQCKPLLFYTGIFPSAHIFKAFPHFLLYKFQCLWFYVEFFDPLRLELCTGDKNGSIHILLHANCQLSQHHRLKMLPFFPLDGFRSFAKDQVTIGVGSLQVGPGKNREPGTAVSVGASAWWGKMM